MKKIIYCFLFGLITIQARAQNISQMEYFIDVDSGFGNCTAINGFTIQPDVPNFGFPVPMNTVPGVHRVGLRSRDAANKWSLTNFYTINVIPDSSSAVINEIEYFWDVDPGFGNATDTILSNPIADLTSGILFAYVPLTLSSGQHTLFVRSRESRNRWSHTNYAQNIIMGVKELSELDEISVYPIPVREKLTIDVKDNEKVRIVLYDMNARLLFDKIIQGKSNIDLIGYTAGTYTILVWKENAIYKRVIVKE